MSLIHSLLDLERKPLARAYNDEAYDLSGFRAWVDRMGAPDRGLRFLHVAGTKGKGSICAMSEAMLRARGLSTGLYTSPHLDHFGERIRVNNVPLTPEEFSAAEQRIEDALSPQEREALHSTGLYRTVFEVLTLMALRVFAEASTEAVVWETGLGGRLDCTNIVDPIVSVISTIGMDHTKTLGETPEAIAFEKAGIMKPGGTVVIARQQPQFSDCVWRVFESRAHAVGATIIRAEEALPLHQCTPTPLGLDATFILPDGASLSVHLPMHGIHQAHNAQAALIACALFSGSEVSDSDAMAGLAAALPSVQWAGRLEVHNRPGMPTLLLDGAHCPLSARAFRRTLQHWQDSPSPVVRAPIALLCGMQADKDHDAFFAALREDGGAALITEVFAYPVPGSRGAPSATIAAAAIRAGFRARSFPTLEEAWYSVLDSNPNAIATAGTLYSLATVRRLHLGNSWSLQH